jgi:hypothetical protein
MSYSILLVDSLNLLHKLHEDAEAAALVSSKYIFKKLAAKYITTLRTLQEQYLTAGGRIYILFDQAPSKHDTKKTFKHAGAGRKAVYFKYKDKRVKESKEFYNTLDLLKYYYLAGPVEYSCIQIQGLEADDLVKPVIENLLGPEDRALMVTNDSDWTRYLSPTVDWLPKLGQPPATALEFELDKNYYPSEGNVVAYKVLFGDSADGVPHILTKTQAHLEEFTNLAASIDLSIVDLLDKARNLNAETLKKSPILSALREQERQAIINLQLVSAVPVKASHLNAAICHGRNSTVVIKAVESAIGLRASKREFVFGNIRQQTQT